MKTNTQKVGRPGSGSGLGSRSAQLSRETTSKARQAVDAAVEKHSTPTAGDVTAQDEKERAERKDNRLPIDLRLRQTNRMLTTEKVIELLRAQAPQFFQTAEVIGKWVWIQFTDKQPREITAQLAQLGFHWNNKRQAWQHPCGVFRKAPSTQDPRERYGSRFPADAKAA